VLIKLIKFQLHAYNWLVVTFKVQIIFYSKNPDTNTVLYLSFTAKHQIYHFLENLLIRGATFKDADTLASSITTVHVYMPLSSSVRYSNSTSLEKLF